MLVAVLQLLLNKSCTVKQSQLHMLELKVEAYSKACYKCNMSVHEDDGIKVVAGRRIEDAVFVPNAKFAYFIVINKPWNVVSNDMVGVDAFCMLFMYTGDFLIEDFAYITAHSTGEELGYHGLPGASKADCMCWWGKTSELLCIPGVVQYEIGYSCFWCKADL